MTTEQRNERRDRSIEPQRSSPSPETGVAGDRAKRAASLGVGAMLLLRGIRRRSARGLVLALVGVGVLARTLLGGVGLDRTGIARHLNRLPKVDRAETAAFSRSVTIGESPDELYDAWRDPDVLSQVMGHFAEVTPIDEDRHRWTVSGPADAEFSWETRIVEAEPGALVRWETTGDASASNGGSVRFRPAPGGRGTVVSLSLTFEPPGETLGAATLERLDVVPETLAGHALGRFKSLVESGEIATLEGNPSGRGAGDLL
ncbi:SRPBCC family protein [Halorubrum sp. CSM-61]|uniref:SRPBCC family protein n=1 Tax=Halorubrum sp. CSM-61 TaxID=2485838 RepID=UPI000F4CDA38|nr:SRPBCC family protein [Halorubrum sp. CSM-61]